MLECDWKVSHCGVDVISEDMHMTVPVTESIGFGEHEIVVQWLLH